MGQKTGTAVDKQSELEGRIFFPSNLPLDSVSSGLLLIINKNPPLEFVQARGARAYLTNPNEAKNLYF